MGVLLSLDRSREWLQGWTWPMVRAWAASGAIFWGLAPLLAAQSSNREGLLDTVANPVSIALAGIAGLAAGLVGGSLSARQFVRVVRLPAVALLMVLVLASLPVLQANAQEPTPEPTPEGAASGCFGGALSRDPLHCYVFEEAQREGIIEIDAIYEGGDGLFIYLKQTEPLGEDLALYFIGKARAEVRRSGGDECVFRDFHCDVGILKRGYERWGFILPVSTVYEDIRVRVGGAESRRLELGWASYRKVWPASADDSAADNGSRSAEIFDISDVDTTTFPEVDCRETPKASYSCGRWRASPGLGVAGAYGNGLFLWLHVKAAPGDEEKLASAREAYANAYNTRPPGQTYHCSGEVRFRRDVALAGAAGSLCTVFWQHGWYRESSNHQQCRRGVLRRRVLSLGECATGSDTRRGH